MKIYQLNGFTKQASNYLKDIGVTSYEIIKFNDQVLVTHKLTSGNTFIAYRITLPKSLLPFVKEVDNDKVEKFIIVEVNNSNDIIKVIKDILDKHRNEKVNTERVVLLSNKALVGTDFIIDGENSVYSVSFFDNATQINSFNSILDEGTLRCDLIDLGVKSEGLTDIQKFIKDNFEMVTNIILTQDRAKEKICISYGEFLLLLRMSIDFNKNTSLLNSIPRVNNDFKIENLNNFYDLINYYYVNISKDKEISKQVIDTINKVIKGETFIKLREDVDRESYIKNMRNLFRVYLRIVLLSPESRQPNISTIDPILYWIQDKEKYREISEREDFDIFEVIELAANAKNFNHFLQNLYQKYPRKEKDENNNDFLSWGDVKFKHDKVEEPKPNPTKEEKKKIKDDFQNAIKYIAYNNHLVTNEDCIRLLRDFSNEMEKYFKRLGKEFTAPKEIIVSDGPNLNNPFFLKMLIEVGNLEILED